VNIGILGTGMVGQTLAGKLTELGHNIVVGTRNVAVTLASVTPTGYGALPPYHVWQKDHPKVKLATFAEAAAHGEIVMNCTSGMNSLEALKLAGEINLDGKILIDASNPLDFSQGIPPMLSVSNTDSLAEQIQRMFPRVRVVKTLNTVNAFVMVNPSVIPGDHNLFLSGNDDEAKLDVITMLTSFGWKANNIIDLGDITTARGTEQYLALWVRLYGKLQNPMLNIHIAVGDPPKM
jgi:8-hydroxy-5-deazaflavin:NADPH oxidoreductase